MPELPAWCYPAWLFFWGSVTGVVLARWWRLREERTHVCRTLLRVANCLFVNCEASTIVTVNDDDGEFEIEGYVIMPRATWDAMHDAAARP